MSKNLIKNHYKFKKIEKDHIKNNFAHHKDWDKECFARIKKSIMEYLRIEQDNECCYCKRKLGFDIKDVDIEHILPKCTFEKFTFEGRNLALSCPGCNTKKGRKSVTEYNYINYPSNGKKIKIVHAHFDDYNDHINIIDNIIYAAKTKKGSETITVCELYRLQKVEENAKKFNFDKEFAQLLELMRNAKGEQIQEFQDLILKKALEDDE